MTIKQTFIWAVNKLQDKSFSSHLDAEVLLSFVLKKPREFLFIHPEKKLTKLQQAKFQNLIRRRVKHEPVAYLTGQKDFYGHKFEVSPATLIPRPETELLVEEALKQIQKTAYRSGRQRTIVIDVGTGTGCIPIAILTTLRSASWRRSNFIHFYATDISPAALRVARANARCHNVKIKFLQGNLLKPLFHNSKFIIQNSQIIITANLPYLTPKQWRQQTSPDIKNYEPRQALVGGADGLKYFRELFLQIKKFNLKSQTLNLQLEIDLSQSSKIKKMAQKYLGQMKIEIKKDLAGHDRLAVISPQPSPNPPPQSRSGRD